MKPLACKDVEEILNIVDFSSKVSTQKLFTSKAVRFQARARASHFLDYFKHFVAPKRNFAKREDVKTNSLGCYDPSNDAKQNIETKCFTMFFYPVALNSLSAKGGYVMMEKDSNRTENMWKDGTGAVWLACQKLGGITYFKSSNNGTLQFHFAGNNYKAHECTATKTFSQRLEESKTADMTACEDTKGNADQIAEILNKHIK